MFVVYTMPNCPHCVGAKELLKSKGLAFEEKIAGKHFSREALIGWLGPVRTLPQIVRKNEEGQWVHIGGFTDLQKTFAGGGVTVRILEGEPI